MSVLRLLVSPLNHPSFHTLSLLNLSTVIRLACLLYKVIVLAHDHSGLPPNDNVEDFLPPIPEFLAASIEISHQDMCSLWAIIKCDVREALDEEASSQRLDETFKEHGWQRLLGTTSSPICLFS